MAVAADFLRLELWETDIIYFPLETELLRGARRVGAAPPWLAAAWTSSRLSAPFGSLQRGSRTLCACFVTSRRCKAFADGRRWVKLSPQATSREGRLAAPLRKHG
jgi:hypothetical protein